MVSRTSFFLVHFHVRQRLVCCYTGHFFSTTEATANITGDHWRDGCCNYPKIMIIIWVLNWDNYHKWWLVVWLIISTNFRVVNWWTIKQHVHCCGSKLSKIPKNQMDLTRILPCAVSRCNVTQPQTSASSLRNSHKNPGVQLATSILMCARPDSITNVLNTSNFRNPEVNRFNTNQGFHYSCVWKYTLVLGEGIDDT